MGSKIVDYKDSHYESNQQYSVGNSSDLTNTLRRLKEEIRSCNADNDVIMQGHEKQVEVNAMILQSLLDLQQQGPHRINYEHENKTNGAYGSRSHGGHRLDRDDTIRDARLLDTPDRRRDIHRYYSILDSDRHYDLHIYHPYTRNDRGYFPYDFKKENPPTFVGYMRNHKMQRHGCLA